MLLYFLEKWVLQWVQEMPPHYAKLRKPQNCFLDWNLGPESHPPCERQHWILAIEPILSYFLVLNGLVPDYKLTVIGNDFPWAQNKKVPSRILLCDLPRTFLKTPDGFILPPCPHVRCLLSLSLSLPLSPLNSSSLWVADVRISYQHPLPQCCVSCWTVQLRIFRRASPITHLRSLASSSGRK